MGNFVRTEDHPLMQFFNMGLYGRIFFCKMKLKMNQMASVVYVKIDGSVNLSILSKNVILMHIEVIGHRLQC